MGKAYGEQRTWSTVGAPHPFSGICEDYSYRDAMQPVDIEGESDIEGIILHGRKGEIGFNTTVTADSADFLDLADGVKIAVDGISTGVILVSQCVERWSLLVPKTAGLSATHYPDMTDSGGAAAGVLSAVSPAQTGLNIRPAGKVVWSTAGMTHTSGIIQALTLTQQVNVQEDTDEVGDIVAAFVNAYKRSIELQLVSKGTKPSPDTILTITGAPAHAAGYIITDVDEDWKKGDKKRFNVRAVWAPGYAEALPPEE